MLVEIPAAANFIVGTFVIVEMASDGTEVLLFGISVQNDVCGVDDCIEMKIHPHIHVDIRLFTPV